MRKLLLALALLAPIEAQAQCSGIFANNTVCGNATGASTTPRATAIGSLVVGQALTRVDDTNVTVTLGGTPATALLQGVSLTMGWSGQLSMARGGTAKSLTAANGGIIYTDADSMEVLAATATAGQMLRSGSNAAPSWSTATFPATATGTGTILRADGTNWVATTATYPATTSVSEILYSSSANVIGGMVTGNNGVLITSAGGVPSISSTIPSATQDNITRVGTITSGTWTGTTIAVANGGTGDTGTAYTITTPSATCGTGSLTTSVTTLRTKQIGKTTFFNLTVVITTNGTCATSITVATGITSAANKLFVGRDLTAGGMLLCNITPTSGVITMLTSAGSYPGADGKTLVCNGTYEAE